MKTMLLTFMMFIGFAMNHSYAQLASCEPCPPGCCIKKGCNPADCAKNGCDISKCNTADAKVNLTSGNDAKMCCATTEAKTSTAVSTDKKMCCSSNAKSSSLVFNLMNPATPIQTNKSTSATASAENLPAQ